MRKALSLIAFYFLLLPLVGNAQMTFSGPPSQEDYDLVCGRLGGARSYCEVELRLRRGVATCDDINWTYSCEVDAMTDAKQCKAYGGGSNLFVFAERGILSFAITGDEYPGEPSVIRIDKNPAISFNHDRGTSRAQDASIEAQIRRGKVIKTRYIKWPTGVSQDQETPVCNLPEVMKAMKTESK